jgi:hypothetical protein
MTADPGPWLLDHEVAVPPQPRTHSEPVVYPKPSSPAVMRAGDIAKAAADLVGGDRQHTHGDKVENHQAIADMWNGYLKAKFHTSALKVRHAVDVAFSAEDVANMMELLKIARRLNGAFNVDDYIDGAGYAACAGEIAGRQAKGE